jgi:uncharacterized protein
MSPLSPDGAVPTGSRRGPSGDSAAPPRPPLSRRGALFLLRAYQGAASGRVSTCRYYPSCSNYAVEAFTVHTFGRALGLTARRLLRCRPFGPHGIDLVPLPEAGHVPEAGHGTGTPGHDHDHDHEGHVHSGHRAWSQQGDACLTREIEVPQPC